MKTELLKVKRVVEEYMGIEDLSIKDRSHEIAMARWLYCKLAREYVGATTILIGKTINRDHSTVVHALKSLDFEFAYNKDLQTKYDDLSIIVMSTIKTFTIEDVDKKISDLENTLSKLKIQRKKIIDESTYTEFENQKDFQVFWS
jgi:hypothetical protein